MALQGTGRSRKPRAWVVVADDDDAMRSLLKTTLEAWGMKVQPAAGGRELLEELDRQLNDDVGPDLIICDLQMPLVNGFDVLDWTQRHLPKIPVILITAFGDRLTHSRALDLGASEVLDKPFDMKQLKKLVDALLLSPPYIPWDSLTS